MLLLLSLSAFAEASILIVSFYWAPWISLAYSSSPDLGNTHDSLPMLPETVINQSEDNSSEQVVLSKTDQDSTPLNINLPYVFIYSSLMLGTMIGNWTLTTITHLHQETIFTRSLQSITPMRSSFK